METQKTESNEAANSDTNSDAVKQVNGIIEDLKKGQFSWDKLKGLLTPMLGGGAGMLGTYLMWIQDIKRDQKEQRERTYELKSEIHALKMEIKNLHNEINEVREEIEEKGEVRSIEYLKKSENGQLNGHKMWL
jgi:hypothetical protein